MIPFRDDVPARRYPAVMVAIILANGATFLYQLSLPSQQLGTFIFEFGVVPQEYGLKLVGQPQLATSALLSLLVSMFLHGGWLHLLGNMWYLWIFGDNVEDRLGHLRFLLFYLLCGLVGSLTHIFFNASSSIPSIGASGAIAGVLGAYLVSFPFARILTLVPLFLLWPIVQLPAIVVLGFWFVLQLVQGGVTAAGSEQGGVAWWAHVGGFVAGAVLLNLLLPKRIERYRPAS